VERDVLPLRNTVHDDHATVISDTTYKKLDVLINLISRHAYELGYKDAKEKAPKDFNKVHIDPILIRKIK
jgi:hypothetical protein